MKNRKLITAVIIFCLGMFVFAMQVHGDRYFMEFCKDCGTKPGCDFWTGNNYGYPYCNYDPPDTNCQVSGIQNNCLAGPIYD